MFLIFATWIVVGVIVGWIATLFVDLRGDQPLIGILAGVGGALIGGLLGVFLLGGTWGTWTVYDLLWPAVGAALAAAIYHGIRSKSISRDAVSDHTTARGVGGRAR